MASSGQHPRSKQSVKSIDRLQILLTLNQQLGPLLSKEGREVLLQAIFEEVGVKYDDSILDAELSGVSYATYQADVATDG